MDLTRIKTLAVCVSVACIALTGTAVVQAADGDLAEDITTFSHAVILTSTTATTQDQVYDLGILVQLPRTTSFVTT